MEQQIRFAKTSDGVSIAYATAGSGPPLVYVCGWPGNLAMEWEQDFLRDFLVAFAAEFTLVRYDMRNSGLSETGNDDMSIAGLVRDLEGVVADLSSEQVYLMSLGLLANPIAVMFADAHPGGDSLLSEQQGLALRSYVEAFGQLLLPQFTAPDPSGIDPQLTKVAGDIHNASAGPEIIVKLLEAFAGIDITSAVERLAMPVLVLHGSEDPTVSLALSRQVAAGIKDVKFVPYKGSGSSAWADRDIVLPEIFEFLGAAQAPVRQTEPAARAAPSATSTVLFTDIVSSTALTQQLGDEQAQELVRAHDRIVRDALASHGGTEVKHTGDGIMASFPTASGAIECAIAIQRAVARDSTLSVRIGLNAGEPVAEESDLFGTAVQLARRLCDKAEGGSIVVSDVVRQLSAGKGFLFTDTGEVELKGFEEPVRVYEVKWRDEG
jgi:class 3 adenylate cyclase